MNASRMILEDGLLAGGYPPTHANWLALRTHLESYDIEDYDSVKNCIADAIEEMERVGGLLKQ